MTNKDILSAVLARWSRPLLQQLMNDNISRIPGLANLEAKMHASGWVGKSWRLSNEIAPFAEPIACALIQPAIGKALAGVDDEQIPALAYGMVDAAIAQGKVSILDGKVTFEAEDLATLRRLLERNIPEPTQEPYKVKENEE